MEPQPRRIHRVLLNVLAAFLLLAAAPAMGAVSIEGVREGEVVRGDLEVSAVSDANRLIEVLIVLTGPDGTAAFNRGTSRRVYLVNEPGDPMSGGAWDTRDVTPGDYTLTAFATARGRTGRVVKSAAVNFTIENDAAPAPVNTPRATTPTPVAPPPAEPEPVVVAEPEVEAVEAVVEQPTSTVAESVAEPAPQVINPVASGLIETEVVVPEVAPGAIDLRTGQPLVAATTSIAFARNAPAERLIGDSAVVGLDVDNPAEGSDVLILVWDLERRTLVRNASAVLQPDNADVPAALLNALPAGNMEIQAHYRENDRIVQTAKHVIAIAEPEPVVEPTGPDAMPSVRFPDNAANTYTTGSSQSLSFEVDGELPGNGDVLAIAWSLDEGRLVEGFALVFTEAPYTISGAMMNRLPQGQVEVQLRPRYNGQIIGKVVQTVSVSAPIVVEIPDAPEPEQPAEGDTPAGDDTQADAGDSNDGDAGGGSPVTDEPVADATPDPDPTPDVPAETPSAPVAADVDFAAGNPTSYVHGSDETIAIELDGELPSGGDVLMLMWHKDRREMVGGFAHELSGSDRSVNNARLDAAPAGEVELQALLRVPGQPIVITKQSMTLIDPDAPEEDPVADNGEAPDFDGVNLSSDGFTQFTKSADTQVIYVAANGNDNNDGLSPNSPMRSPSAAYKKLRHGKPDWLLFKAGDTFRGNLGVISKSGRSASEPILISSYGEGPRPIMLSPSGKWAEKYFQTNGDNVAFVGLHIIAENRDVTRSGFNGNNLSSNVWNASAITFLGDTQNLLIEDCILEYFKFAIVVQSGSNDGYARGIKIRRNAVLYSYGHWDKAVAGHSSGMYGAYIDGLLIEENVWHHNGWTTRVNGAHATKFNHNMYIQDDCTGNSVVRGNIISRGSAHGLQLRSGGDVIDNLFVENPLAFFVGRYESDVLRNVVLKSQNMATSNPQDRYRGHGMEVLPCLFARVENNIFSQKEGTADAAAISFTHERNYANFLNGRPFRATLKDNKIYNWPRREGSSDSSIFIGTGVNFSERTRNDLNQASGGDSNPPWVDPERDVESYMQSIGQPASLDALVQRAAYRPRGQWAEEYSASAVNLYVRRGFDVRPFD